MLPPGVSLPDGSEVFVEPVAGANGEAAAGSILECDGKFAGCLKGLPEDFPENHDHYLHGAEKRSS